MRVLILKKYLLVFTRGHRKSPKKGKRELLVLKILPGSKIPGEKALGKKCFAHQNHIFEKFVDQD